MSVSRQPVLVCPHCGNQTPHKRIFTHSFQGAWYNQQGMLDEDPPSSSYTGWACSTCGDLSIFENIDDEDSLGSIVFPTGTELDESVPRAIVENYREAKRVQKLSPNACAVLMRRALEAICDDRGIKNGNLQSRLTILADKNEIPPILAEVTTVLRTIGNAGAHNNADRVTVPMTWRLDKLFKMLIEYVYVAPARLLEFKDSLRKRAVPKPKED